MLETIENDWRAKFAVVFFVIYTFLWIELQFIPYNPKNLYFNIFYNTYGFLALLGGIWGFRSIVKWGVVHEYMGRAIAMFSLGLLFQEFGQITFCYSVLIMHVKIPYPSIADIGYFGSVLCYIFGTILLARAAGIKKTLESYKDKLKAILIPLFILSYCYFHFLQYYIFDWHSPIKIFLDFAYPLGQATYISIALLTFLLLRHTFAETMRSKIFYILIALFLQFAADFNFLYQSSRGIWTNTGYGEYLYLVAYFFMTMSLLYKNDSAIISGSIL